MSTQSESDGGVPATQPVGANIDAPAQVPASPMKGMFGVSGTGDVSGPREMSGSLGGTGEFTGGGVLMTSGG